MSEVAPNIGPFTRKLPEKAANEPINAMVRGALANAVAAEQAKPHASREAYVDAVIDTFYLELGAGALGAVIEFKALSLPDAYVGRMPRRDSALKFLDRADFRGYANPVIFSPILGLASRDEHRVCYVGSDKFGHFIQQGYDYHTILRAIERKRPGYGLLYAQAWGAWLEGEELSAEAVERYLASHDLPDNAASVAQVQRELHAFLTQDDLISSLSPMPEFAKGNRFLKSLARTVGVHQRGIMGLTTTGIYSNADLAANEAGLRFYLDLERDPEKLAERFDIADYADCSWDEEVLPSKFSPEVKARIDEAVRGEKRAHFATGLAFGFNLPNYQFSLSTPLAYYASLDEDYEIRLRLGASIPLSGNEKAYAEDSQLFTALDASVRLTGLNYLYFSGELGITPQIISDDPARAVRPAVETGYEVMLGGWGSLQFGLNYDIIKQLPSAAIGALLLWR